MQLWEGILLSLGGGVALGLSTATWLHTSGQVTGISGFLRGLIDPAKWKENRSLWRPAWLAAFASTAAVLSIAQPDWFGKGDRADGTMFSYILGGFFVGLGTSMGNGCTSVPDSLSWAADISNDASWEFAAAYASVTGVLALGLIAAAWRLHGTEEGHHTAAAAAAGLLFSGGMSVGGMMDRSVILSFLSLTQDWSPRLAFVMGGGVTVSIIAFHYVNVRHAAAASCPYERGTGELASDFTEDERKAMTFLGRAYKVPGNTLINFQLVLGAMLFGLGWGMSGFCPGPALGVMASGAARSWLWLPGFALGVGAWIGWEHWLAVKGDKSAAATKRSTRANSASSSSGRSSPAAVVPTMPRTVPDFAAAPPLDAAGRQKARRMLRHALALLGEDETTATATSTKAQHSKKTPLLSADAVGSESCRAETFQAIQAHGDGTSDLLCAALRVAALAEKAPGASSAGSGRSSAASSVQAGSDCGFSDLPDV